MKQPIIAVDIDDVLADENGAVIEFINKNYGTKHTLKDYYNADAPYYGFWEVAWGVDKAEADRRYKAFIDWKSKNHLSPLPGAIDSIKQLKQCFKLVIVTSRNNALLASTKNWLNQHFPEIFSSLLFVELWEDGRSSKAEISHKLGASYLIDDNIDHCSLASKLGIKSLLFGSYGWNRSPTLPENVTRVKNWQEVLEYFDGRSE